MAPPGMPKTTSTPSASSDRTRALAPVISSTTVLARAAGGAGVPGGTGVAAAPVATAAAPLARWARVSGVGLLMSGLLPRSLGVVRGRALSRATKKPACWTHGGSRTLGWRVRLGKYSGDPGRGHGLSLTHLTLRVNLSQILSAR